MKVNGRGGNLTPATQKPLNRWSPKFVYLTTPGISTTMQNFIQIGLGVSVLRMRDFVPLGTKWLGYFLGGFLRKATAETRTDFDAKYVKRRGSAQVSAFWGSRNQNLRLRPHFPQNPPFLGPISDRIFSAKTALTLDGSRVNDP